MEQDRGQSVVQAVASVLCASFALLCAPSFAAHPNLILQVGHFEEIVGKPSVSPDGRLAVSMDRGRTVILWDMNTGQQLRRLVPSEEKDGNFFVGNVGGKGATTIHSGQAVFSPDGKTLAATAEQGVTLWSVHDGRKLRDIKLGSSNVFHTEGLAFSPDGKRIVVPRSLGVGLAVLDVATGSTIYETGSALSGNFAFNVVSWSPDGRFIAAASSSDCPGRTSVTSIEEAMRRAAEVQSKGGETCVIRIFNATDGSELKALESVYGGNINFAFDPSGKFLAAMGKQKVQLYEIGRWREVASLKPTNQALTFIDPIAFSPDGKWLTAGGKTLKQWDMTNLGMQASSIELPFPTFSYTWSPDSRSLIVFGKRGAPQLIAHLPPSSQTNWSNKQPDPSLARTSVSVDSEGKRMAVVSGSASKTQIALWDLKAGSLASKINYDERQKQGFRYKTRLLFEPTSSWLGLLGTTGIDIFDIQSAKKKFTLPGSEDVSLTSDGRILAAAGYGLFLYDTQSGEKIANYPTIVSGKSLPRFARVSISPDGRWVAGHQSGKGGGIRIWDVRSGQELSARPPTGGWQLLQFDRSGLLYHLGEESSIVPLSIWNVERGEKVNPPAHVGNDAFQWTFDGRRFALCCSWHSEGQQGLTRILDTNNGKLWPLRDSRFVGSEVEDLALFPNDRHIAIAGSDGTVRILTLDTGELLITLLSISGSDDWLAFTPDGFFDGTPGGWDVLLWRFSDELYDVAPGEAFFNEFYRPGLLAEIMAGARPKAPRSLAEVDRRQPQVTLQVAGGTERQARVRIDVKEAPPGVGRTGGSGVRDVRLFRNGSLVKRWAGEVAGGAGMLEASVPIVAGENRFTAYAFNRDNIKSGDARAQLTGADNLKRPATAWVLAFGINRYANRAFDLNFSVADAQAFAEQIGQGQTQLGRYQKVNLVSLKDAEATKANLLSALRRLSGKDSGPVPKGAPKALAELKPAQPEDAVFIFFAGHGLADGPRFYLVPHDLGYMGDPEQFDEKARATVFRHAVSDQELEAALESLDAERITLTIDACHSGQALEAEERRRGPMNSKGLAQLAYEKGMYVITAAQSHQAALEFGQLGHGLLTYALVKEGLAQGQADRQPQDGRVEVREWLDYASARVPQLQLEAMRATAQRGRNVAVIRGEEKVADFLQRTLQQPRVFYRREPERSPFVIGGK